jgi:hypothetical protein
VRGATIIGFDTDLISGSGGDEFSQGRTFKVINLFKRLKRSALIGPQ